MSTKFFTAIFALLAAIFGFGLREALPAPLGAEKIRGSIESSVHSVLPQNFDLHLFYNSVDAVAPLLKDLGRLSDAIFDDVADSPETGRAIYGTLWEILSGEQGDRIIRELEEHNHALNAVPNSSETKELRSRLLGVLTDARAHHRSSAETIAKFDANMATTGLDRVAFAISRPDIQGGLNHLYAGSSNLSPVITPVMYADPGRGADQPSLRASTSRTSGTIVKLNPWQEFFSRNVKNDSGRTSKSAKNNLKQSAMTKQRKKTIRRRGLNRRQKNELRAKAEAPKADAVEPVHVIEEQADKKPEVTVVPERVAAKIDMAADEAPLSDFFLAKLLAAVVEAKRLLSPWSVPAEIVKELAYKAMAESDGSPISGIELARQAMEAIGGRRIGEIERKRLKQKRSSGRKRKMVSPEKYLELLPRQGQIELRGKWDRLASRRYPRGKRNYGP